MASTTSKLIEHIPYFDGTFRRRFIAGGLVVLPIIIFTVLNMKISISDLDLEIKDLITSPAIALGLLILIYAIGNVVEMIGEIFISRIVGNLVWALQVPMYLFSNKPRWIRYVMRALLWYPGFIFLFYWYFLKGLLGISNYKWISLRNSLDNDAQNSFEKLPSIVKRSLMEPFGNYGDIAFKYFKNSVSENDQDWITKLETRNKDILSTIAAIFILVMFFLFTLPAMDATIVLPHMIEQPAAALFAIFSQVLALIVFTLFFGYFLILRKSIIETLELWSIKRFKDVTELRNTV